jgi:hypothetical protein
MCMKGRETNPKTFIKKERVTLAFLQTKVHDLMFLYELHLGTSMQPGRLDQRACRDGIRLLHTAGTLETTFILHVQLCLLQRKSLHWHGLSRSL